MEMDLDLDLGENGTKSEFEFWPLQHPTEPPDEDKPLKCPISDTSPVNGRRRHGERFSDSLPTKRAEYSEVVQKQDMVVVAAEQTVRAVRKRHHILTTTHGDHTTVTPLLRMPPIYPYSVPQNMTIFDMMQHFNKFES